MSERPAAQRRREKERYERDFRAPGTITAYCPVHQGTYRRRQEFTYVGRQKTPWYICKVCRDRMQKYNDNIHINDEIWDTPIPVTG